MSGAPPGSYQELAFDPHYFDDDDCPTCEGHGEVGGHICPECGGTGEAQ